MKTLYKRLLIIGVCLLVIGSFLPAVITLPVPVDDYDTTTVTVTDCNGNEETTFTVDIAESSAQKYVGLSRHTELQSGEGMLFPYSSTGERTFVMRNMDFPIAVVFIDEDKTITDIQIGEAPSGVLEYYLTYERVTGEGRYVLEIPKEDMGNVSVGSCVSGVSTS